MDAADVPTTISVQEAGQLIGISTRTAYRAANRGQIPTMRIGRRLFVPTRPLLAMLGLEPEEAVELIKVGNAEEASA